jgi:hypothetical protein
MFLSPHWRVSSHAFAGLVALVILLVETIKNRNQVLRLTQGYFDCVFNGSAGHGRFKLPL